MLLLIGLVCLAQSSRLSRARSLVDGPNVSIVNGNDASECKWKHQVSLQKSFGHNCGGTIINPEWVLTAPHCGTNVKDSVLAGQLKLSRSSSNTQKRQVAEVHSHPKYRSAGNAYDLELLKVDKPFKMTNCVGIASLPSRDAAVGRTDCWITGWGHEKRGGKIQDTLQEGQVSIFSNSKCRSMYGGDDKIHDVEICAQGSRNGKIIDACQMDSGGPLVCGSGGSWTLYGATSWGQGCAAKQFPGVWARVHHEMKWIRKTMG